jgi:glutathione synthase/RimK-type ligase-like ATP-grasp enzyme
MEQLKHLNNPIFYITNDPERAVGLETVLPNYHIICIDYTTLVDQLIRKGVKIFCLEKELGEINPIYRNSNRLLNHELVLEYIKKNTENNQKPYIQVFKIAPNIERTAEKYGFKLLNTEAKLNRNFENKIPQFNNLGDLGFFPKTEIVKLKNYTFQQLKKEVGSELVLQFNRGHTGESTIFLKSQNQFEEIKNKFPERSVRISKFIDGEAWTLNACQTRYGTFYGGLSYQITGVKECTNQKGGTVGNDWSCGKKVTDSIYDQIDQIIRETGNKMYSAGYKGLYGLDLVIDKNEKVWLIEINARQPASTPMHTQLLLAQELIPLSLLHILEFTYPDGDYLTMLNLINPAINTKEFMSQYNKEAIKPIEASQLFLRNTKDEKNSLKNGIECGIYDLHLNKLKNEYKVTEAKIKNPLIFSYKKGHIIKPGREIARIQSLNGIVNSEGKLYNEYLELVKLIKDKVL